jgi:hypothetical protein
MGRLTPREVRNVSGFVPHRQLALFEFSCLWKRALACMRQLRIGMKFFENRTGPSCFAELWS